MLINIHTHVYNGAAKSAIHCEEGSNKIRIGLGFVLKKLNKMAIKGRMSWYTKWS